MPSCIPSHPSQNPATSTITDRTSPPQSIESRPNTARIGQATHLVRRAASLNRRAGSPEEQEAVEIWGQNTTHPRSRRASTPGHGCLPAAGKHCLWVVGCRGGRVVGCDVGRGVVPLGWVRVG